MEKVKTVRADRGTRTSQTLGGRALCAWRSRAFYVLPFALCLAGCVSTDSFLQWGEPKPVAEPCRVVAAWNPAVVYTPDPAHDGTPIPGLAGRIYLFGPEIGCPMLGNGSLHVALYDDTQCGFGKDSPPLEEWQFDAETLKRLKHHDPVGWGYTVFLPWGTYRPEITRIHLKARYEPPHGFPIYAASAPVTLVDPNKMDKWESSVAQVTKKGEPISKLGSGVTTPSAPVLLPVGARGKP